MRKCKEEKNIELNQNKPSKTNLVSKRPIQNAKETLDIEPLNEENLENFEIDDPW